MEKAGEQGNGIDDGSEPDSVSNDEPRPTAPPPPPLGTALPPLQTRPVGSTSSEQSTWGLDDPTGPLPLPGAGAASATSDASTGTIPAPPQPPMPPRPPAGLALPTTAPSSAPSPEPPTTPAVEQVGDESDEHVELEDIQDPSDSVNPDDEPDSFEDFEDDIVDHVDDETDDEFGEEIDTEFDEVDDDLPGRFEEIKITDDAVAAPVGDHSVAGLDEETDLGIHTDLDADTDLGFHTGLDEETDLGIHIDLDDTELHDVTATDLDTNDVIDLRSDDEADDDVELDLDETVVHDLAADVDVDIDAADTAIIETGLDETVAHEVKTGFDPRPAADATEAYDVRTALDPANPQNLSADQEANWSTVFGEQQASPAGAADATPTVTDTIDEGIGPATIAAATAATAVTAATAATVAADASATTVIESPMIQNPVEEIPAMPAADLPTAFDSPDTTTRQYDEFQASDQTLVNPITPDGFVEGEPGTGEPVLLTPDEQYGEPILAPVSTVAEAEATSYSVLTAIAGPLIAIVAAAAVWVALTTGSSPIIEAIYWPSPSAAIDAFNDLLDEGFLNTVGLTAARLGFALGLGAISGLVFGWLLGRFGRIRNLLRPVTSAGRILSPFLLAPFFLLWGVDRGIVSWLPAALGVFALVSWLATADVDDSRRGMSRNLGERLLMTLRTALLPAWTLVYATEMFVGVDGIGGRMRIALNFLEADVMAVWLIAAIVLALAADLVLRLVQYLFARAARRRLTA